MNKKSIIIFLFLAILGVSSCSQKMDFKTASFVSFSSTKYTVKEDAGEIKIPVSVFSDKTLSTTVTYTLTSGEKFAKPSEDYTLEGTGVLNITNAKGEISDSIVIKPVAKVGEIQGNKTIEIVLGEVTEDGLYKGATSKCTVTIIDIDGGINLLVGSWSGSNLKSSKNDASIDWNIALVEDDDEGLKNFPKANVKVLAGSKVTDPVGNSWGLQADLYGYFDDETSELHIYPHQCFDGGNFGDPIGIAYAALDVKATLGGTDTDITFVVEEGLMTLSDGIFLALYADQSGSKFTGYTCGEILAGAQLIKN